MTDNQSNEAAISEDSSDLLSLIEPESEERTTYDDVDDAFAALTERAEARAETERYLESEALSDDHRKRVESTIAPTEQESSFAENLNAEAQSLQRDLQAYQAARQQIDLDKLRKENPQQWTAVKMEIEQIESQLQGRVQHVQQAQHRLKAARDQRVLAAEQQKMVAAAPELADPAVKAELRDYLLRSGHSKEEIEDAVDHRIILHAYRAMKAEKASQRPKNVVYKRRGRGPKQNTEVAAAQRRLKQTGSIHDALDLLTAKKTRSAA